MSARVKGCSTKPIAIRLTTEEYQQLQKAAAGIGVSEYVREKVFAGSQRAPRGKSVVTDHVVAAQLLAKLGSSGLSASLNSLARTAQYGGLDADESLALKSAFNGLASMKSMLMSALGIIEL